MTLPKWFDLSSTLVRNTGWVLVSEGVSRATRLVTVIVLAATLSSAEYGTAMLAVAWHEILRVFMRSGAGPKVIQCTEMDLPQIARNGASLQWLICLSLGFIQLAAAQGIAHFYHNPVLASLMMLMAFSYALFPLVSVNVFMLQRSNQMRYVSLASGACVMVENLGCAGMLWAGAGIQSVAYAKLLSALAWVLCFYAAPVKNYGLGFHAATIRQLARYSGSILGTEMLRSLRTQLDMIIAGRLLPLELLGIYSFAKSAGVGLSQSLSAAYLSGLYPHICKLQRQGAAGFNYKYIFMISGCICMLFIAQAALAPVYIHWLFAARWHDSAALVSLLCLTAIPALLVDTECCLLRAQSRVNRELFITAFCVVSSALAIVVLHPRTPIDLALVVCSSSLLWLLIFIRRSSSFVFSIPRRVSL